MFILRMQTQLSSALSSDTIMELTGKMLYVTKVAEDDTEYPIAKNKYCLFVSDTTNESDSIIMGTFNAFNTAKNALGKIYTSIAAGERGTRVMDDTVD